jgi:serine/threonine protein kinase
VKETYEIGRVLGHGASGKVYAVTHKQTGQAFACKVVKKNSSMNDAQSMSTEIEIMKRIRHRNIVSMYELYEVRIYMYVCVYVCMCMCVCVCMYMCVCMYIYVYVCVCDIVSMYELYEVRNYDIYKHI